jgi:serine/threonine protein phosphatase PrpC
MPQLAGDDWESIAAQFEYLTLKESLVKKARASLQKRIKERIKAEDDGFVANKHSYKMTKVPKTTYTPSTTLAALADGIGGTQGVLMDKITSVTKAALTKALKGSELDRSAQLVLQGELDALAKVSHTSRLVSKAL